MANLNNNNTDDQDNNGQLHSPGTINSTHSPQEPAQPRTVITPSPTSLKTVAARKIIKVMDAAGRTRSPEEDVEDAETSSRAAFTLLGHGHNVDGSLDKDVLLRRLRLVRKILGFSRFSSLENEGEEDMGLGFSRFSSLGDEGEEDMQSGLGFEYEGEGDMGLGFEYEDEEDMQSELGFEYDDEGDMGLEFEYEDEDDMQSGLGFEDEEDMGLGLGLEYEDGEKIWNWGLGFEEAV